MTLKTHLRAFFFYVFVYISFYIAKSTRDLLVHLFAGSEFEYFEVDKLPLIFNKKKKKCCRNRLEPRIIIKTVGRQENKLSCLGNKKKKK